MRISRDTERKTRRLGTSRGQSLQVYELVNLAIWAIIFVAAGLIVEGKSFNALAPFMAVGMVLSTMVVRWGRKQS